MGKNSVFKACLDSVPLLGKDALSAGVGGMQKESVRRAKLAKLTYRQGSVGS